MICKSIPQSDLYVAEGVIEHGLKEAMKNSHNLVSYDSIIQLIRDGIYGLWLLFDNDLYAGFVITELVEENGRVWANIVWVYAKPGYSPYDAMREAIVPVAKENNLAGVKFFSSRPGFERISKKLGLTKRFVEYIVEEFGENK